MRRSAGNVAASEMVGASCHEQRCPEESGVARPRSGIPLRRALPVQVYTRSFAAEQLDHAVAVDQVGKLCRIVSPDQARWDRLEVAVRDILQPTLLRCDLWPQTRAQEVERVTRKAAEQLVGKMGDIVEALEAAGKKDPKERALGFQSLAVGAAVPRDPGAKVRQRLPWRPAEPVNIAEVARSRIVGQPHHAARGARGEAGMDLDVTSRPTPDLHLQLGVTLDGPRLKQDIEAVLSTLA